MPGIPIKLEIDEKEILQALAAEVVKELNKILLGMVNSAAMKDQIRQLLESEIKNSPEYDSLSHGKLAAIFGLENPQSILTNIIETIKNSIHIEFKPATFNANGIRASITVSLLRDDFQDVLAIDGTAYETDGGIVDWLNWLLTSGDNVVIVGFDAVLGNSFTGSRTGLGIMEKQISGFRVPPEFSGTLTNNWLTRAVADMDQLIGNILFVELNRRL